MDQNYMKERPVFPLVLAMSFPMVLSMLVNALYNIVDSYFVAKISEHAMTALSLVYPVQNLTVAVGVGFGIGINAAAHLLCVFLCIYCVYFSFTVIFIILAIFQVCISHFP